MGNGTRRGTFRRRRSSRSSSRMTRVLNRLSPRRITRAQLRMHGGLRTHSHNLRYVSGPHKIQRNIRTLRASFRVGSHWRSFDHGGLASCEVSACRAIQHTNMANDPSATLSRPHPAPSPLPHRGSKRDWGNPGGIYNSRPFKKEKPLAAVVFESGGCRTRRGLHRGPRGRPRSRRGSSQNLTLP